MYKGMVNGGRKMKVNNEVYGIYCDNTSSLVINYRTYQGNTKKALFSTKRKAEDSIKYLEYSNMSYKYFVCKIDTIIFKEDSQDEWVVEIN